MLLGDGDLDFTTLFLLSNTMQQDCVHSTDDQMMMYMPLLLGGVSSCDSFLCGINYSRVSISATHFCNRFLFNVQPHTRAG